MSDLDDVYLARRPFLVVSGADVAKRKNAWERRIRLHLDVIEAYQRHYGSTTQREQAATDLGMDLATFRAALDGARRAGFDIEAAPDRDH